MPTRNKTGRFETRESLEDIVWWLWNKRGKSMQEIGEFCGVSRSVVARIIHKKWSFIRDE